MSKAGHSRFLRQSAVQMQLHVARALELLVDHVVHAAAGIDKAGGDDGEAAALFRIACGAKETLRRIQRNRINAAGEGTTAGRHPQVVRAGQPGEAVQEDDYVLAAFTNRFARSSAISATRIWSSTGSSKGGADDFAPDGALHIRYLFWTLANQTDHELDVTVVATMHWR